MRLLFAAILVLAVSYRASGQTYAIDTLAGGGLPENIQGTSARLAPVTGVAVDGAANVYVALQGYNVVLKLSSQGFLTRVAGNGTQGYRGDGGPAASAQLDTPIGLAVDFAGNLYISETFQNRIRKVSNGVITTVAGNGTAGFDGDNGPATSAELYYPYGIAMDAAGDLYIADSLNNRIRKVSNGVITTVAGDGTCCSDSGDGRATGAGLWNPHGVAVDAAGNLYLADTRNHRIRKVSDGGIATVAGNGTRGFGGDNGPATSAQLAFPYGVAVSAAGDLLDIADTGNERIRRVSGGVIATVAGNGTAGFSGDNGAASSAQLNGSESVAVDAAGNLYIADRGNERVRKVSNGVITTAAGNPTQGYVGDGGPPAGAQLYYPYGVAVDSSGDLYIAEECGRIRKVSNGIVATLAGDGTPGFAGDNGPAGSALFDQPEAVAIDSAGNLFIADTGNHRIRKVANGMVTTVAGNGEQGFGGDNGPATSAQLDSPYGVAVNAAGDIFIADTGNHRIRKVSGGVITTVAGDGNTDFSGDNGPAVEARLAFPFGIAVGIDGNLYIADSGHNRVRKVSNGVITTVAGNGALGVAGDNGPAIDAQLDGPEGIAVDAAGNLYFTESEREVVRKVSNEVITTVAGNGTEGFSGDGGPATRAQLYLPFGVAVNAAGALYVADYNNHRVRFLKPVPAAALCRRDRIDYYGGRCRLPLDRF